MKRFVLLLIAGALPLLAQVPPGVTVFDTTGAYPWAINSSGYGPVTVQNSVAVTNAGTFAVQSAQSGTWTVGISAAQTIAVTNTGTFAVQAAQSGTWTVGISASQTIAVTNAGTFAVQNTANASTNITQIGGSALSIGTQTAANSVPVALPTATITSLQQPTLQSGSTTAVTQATAANLNATIVGTLTNNNAAPSTNNVGVLPCLASTSSPTPTTGDLNTLSCLASNGALRTDTTSVNAITVLTGAGATGTGSQRFTAAQDATTVAGMAPATPGSALAANAIPVCGTDGTNCRLPFYDPCMQTAWTRYVVNITSNTQMVAGSSSKKVYICDVFFPPQPNAVNMNIVESATSNNACATSPTGMIGGTGTTTTSSNIVVSGGMIHAFGGQAFAVTATAADAVCILASAQLIGVVSYVQQ